MPSPIEVAQADIMLGEPGAHEMARQVLLNMLHEDWLPWQVEAMLYGLRIYGRVQQLRQREAEAVN